MTTFRRSGAALVAAALFALAACSSGPTAAPSTPSADPAAATSVAANPPRPPDCGPVPPADPATADGWLGIVASRPGDVGFVLDDGRGTVISHGARTPVPLASAAKVVHLAAYGRAVAEGRLRPDEPVAVADWERWYLPGADAGAHPAALARLRPGPSVTIDQLVTAMVRESDNAAADWLRDRLGDDALARAAADAGWTPFDAPSFLGAVLALGLPEQAPPVEAPRAQRAPAELALARRYAADPAFRAEAQRRYADLVADVEAFVIASQAWAPQTASATAAQVAAMYRALSSGSYGAGADVAMRQLTWTPPLRNGQVAEKGGSYPGVLTVGFALRRPDGSTAVGAFLARGLPVDVVPSPDTQRNLAIRGVEGGTTARRLLCVS